MKTFYPPGDDGLEFGAGRNILVINSWIQAVCLNDALVATDSLMLSLQLKAYSFAWSEPIEGFARNTVPVCFNRNRFFL